MRRLFGEQRSFRTLAIMIGINFGATNKLLRNWGVCVETIFLTRVREGEFVKELVPI